MLVVGPPEAALNTESCVLTHKEEVPTEGCARKSPTGILWPEVI